MLFEDNTKPQTDGGSTTDENTEDTKTEENTDQETAV